MNETRATHLTWHAGLITAADRERLNGHRSAVIWLTGLPASGKSTLARALEVQLHRRGCRAYVLDGDNLRHGLNRNLGFSPEDRYENIRRAAEVARLFADAGLIVVTAFISPSAADRQMARAINNGVPFVEVYCDCPLEVCERRDPKGLYRRARAGQIREFTGVDAPYDVPQHPELTVHTAQETVEACTARILTYLQHQGIFRPPT